MGGNTGNIRTLRNQSGTVGERTLGSIIASDSGNGAGSIARLAKWYSSYYGISTRDFYQQSLQIKKGSFSQYDRYNNNMLFNMGNTNSYVVANQHLLGNQQSTNATALGSNYSGQSQSNSVGIDIGHHFSGFPINKYLYSE